jgi:hypothetical protein
MSTAVKVENVVVTTEGKTVEINPTLLASENITLNDVYNCLTKEVAGFDKAEIVHIKYKGVSFNLTGTKRNLTNELKSQILAQFPILKGFEAYGKEIGKPLMAKFLASCVRATTVNDLENTFKLILILSTKKSIFSEIDGLKDVCQATADKYAKMIEDVKETV